MTMENDENDWFHVFINQLQAVRKEADITVTRLCSDSCISTRTFAKMVKMIPVKGGCYIRLVRGICKGCTYEEFMKFWMKLGEWIYWQNS